MCKGGGSSSITGDNNEQETVDTHISRANLLDEDHGSPEHNVGFSNWDPSGSGCCNLSHCDLLRTLEAAVEEDASHEPLFAVHESYWIRTICC